MEGELVLSVARGGEEVFDEVGALVLEDGGSKKTLKIIDLQQEVKSRK